MRGEHQLRVLLLQQHVRVHVGRLTAGSADPAPRHRAIMAMPRYAQFVYEAFERAFDAAVRESDDARVANALARLERVVSLRVLPAAALERIIDMTRARMTTAQPLIIWTACVDLAVATGDRTLCSMVSRIASGQLRPAGADDERVHRSMQKAAVCAVERW